ncbi:MAG: phage tail assembly protein [Rubrivivax sp.]|nr:phage tail assembly protein [Rubrivivax sp.]
MTARTVTLKHPIVLKDKDGTVLEEIREVKIERPNGKRMKAMDNAKGEIGKLELLIGACAQLPPSTVDLMDGEDIMACGEVLSDFLGQPLVTGEK